MGPQWDYLRAASKAAADPSAQGNQIPLRQPFAPPLQERWIIALLASHVVLLVIVIALRKNQIVHSIIFFGISELSLLDVDLGIALLLSPACDQLCLSMTRGEPMAA
jgi:hypothetical protein